MTCAAVPSPRGATHLSGAAVDTASSTHGPCIKSATNTVATHAGTMPFAASCAPDAVSTADADFVVACAIFDGRCATVARGVSNAPGARFNKPRVRCEFERFGGRCVIPALLLLPS